MADNNPTSDQPKLPGTYYVGRGVLIEWLGEWGLKPQAVRTLIENGTIPQHPIAGFSRKVKYVPGEIVNILGLGK